MNQHGWWYPPRRILRRPVGIDLRYFRMLGVRSLRRLTALVALEGRGATARGQLVNPLTRAHLRLASRWPRDPGEPDRPLFVVGMGRSGTTFLLRLLSAAPGVVTMNEPTLVWTLVRPDTDVTAHFGERGRLHVAAAEADTASRAVARRLITHCCRVTAASRYVEKTPEHAFRTDWLRALVPSAQCVGLVRRPDAVARSVERFNRTYGVGDADWWGRADAKWTAIVEELERQDHPLTLVARDVDRAERPLRVRALVEWVLYTSAVLDGRGLSWPLLDYDDLCRRPVESLEIIGASAGLSVDARARAYAAAEARLRDRGSTTLDLAGVPGPVATEVRSTWDRAKDARTVVEG